MDVIALIDKMLPYGRILFMVGIFGFIMAGVSLFKMGRLNKGGGIKNLSLLEAEFNRLTRIAMVCGVGGGFCLFIAVAMLVVKQAV